MSAPSSARAPTYGPSAQPSSVQLVLRQYDYWVTVYRRTWRGSVISSFLLPLLFLAAMGVGLGGFVDDQADAGALGGLDYLAFIAPGLLATTAMQTAIGESMWPVLGNFKWGKVYFSQAATPLRSDDILLGHLLFVAFRIATTAVVFIAVIVAFGAVSSVAGAVGALLISVLVGMAHATPVFAFAATREDPSAFAVVYRVVIIPLSLFSGAFFPVSQLPGVLEVAAYVTPTWHGVEVTRMATTGTVDWIWMLVHVSYLLVWMMLGWLVARRTFARRLTGG
ncbi:ABC transporter permease [soil metagenome]|jgi:lipooligosaccharide transport system permease protein